MSHIETKKMENMEKRLRGLEDGVKSLKMFIWNSKETIAIKTQE